MTNEKIFEEFREDVDQRLRVLEEEVNKIQKIINGGAHFIVREDGMIVMEFNKT